MCDEPLTGRALWESIAAEVSGMEGLRRAYKFKENTMRKTWDEMSMKERILGMTDDLMTNFLYYHRKEDEDFPVGAIEAAIKNSVVSVDEIVACFRSHIEGSLD